MFGYVRAYKPQMRFCEYDTYKAVYCTLCRRQGRLFGIMSRFALRYDIQFLALLCVSVSERFFGFERKRCVVNPLKKCCFCNKEQNGDFDYPAAAAMILVYYKLIDNCRDGRGAVKLFWRILRALFSRKHKKAAAMFPNVEKICAEYYASQCKLESERNAGLDEAAEPTAAALAELFALCDKTQEDILRTFGYGLGRWVYISDALADLRDDIKNGSFNPLSPYTERLSVREIAEKIAEPNLNQCAAVCADSLEALKVYRFRPILENVVYLGLENSYKAIKKSEDSHEKPL